MTVTERDRAKKELAQEIAEHFKILLKPGQTFAGGGWEPADVSVVTLILAENLVGSDDLLLKLAEIAPEKKIEWLTTEDAAKRSGFSRPFIAALLDGPFFVGKVRKTEKGHRRISADDFQRWLDTDHRVADLPQTVEDVLSDPTNHTSRLVKETANEKTQRIRMRDEALATARDLGLK